MDWGGFGLFGYAKDFVKNKKKIKKLHFINNCQGRTGCLDCLRRKAMGWVWKDDDDDTRSGNVNESNTGAGDSFASAGRCSTRKIITSNCKTEEVEPGKFVRKCEKTEKLLKDCAGRFHFFPLPSLYMHKHLVVHLVE